MFIPSFLILLEKKWYKVVFFQQCPTFLNSSPLKIGPLWVSWYFQFLKSFSKPKVLALDFLLLGILEKKFSTEGLSLWLF